MSSSILGAARVQKTPHIIAIENSVVDLQYRDADGDAALKNEFFSHLRELIAGAGFNPGFDDNPRPGDMRLISAEAFDGALVAFGKAQNLLSAHDLATLDTVSQAEAVRTAVFGPAYPIAGGSLANTFHTLVNSRVSGKQLVTGEFITATGRDSYGRIFEASLRDHIVFKERGRQLVCHVFPTGNDRILIATPSTIDPAEGHITADLIDGRITADVKRIMIGGFLFFTGRFKDVMDKVIGDVSALPQNERPTLVMTAAAQSVAEQSLFRAEFNRAARTSDLIVHANTGEFRRLMDMDTDWRKPYDADFTGLKGQDLETVKEAHHVYQAAKQQANHQALDKAHLLAADVLAQHGRNLTFVVTNGAREIYTVNATGTQTHKPLKIAKSQIVNTVGAGDNFAAGFQLGDLYGLPHANASRIGSEMAASVIQIASARLDDTKENVLRIGQHDHLLGGGMAYLSRTALGLEPLNPPAAPKTPRP